LDRITYEDTKLNNTAVALGKFEGLHKGHMLLVNCVCQKSKELGLKGVVFTINMSQDKVINLPCERRDILEKSGIDVEVSCDFTPEFGSMSPKEFVEDILVKKLGAKLVVVGTDFRFGNKRAGDVAMLKSFGKDYGFEVIAFDKLMEEEDVISSTLIREMIEIGNVKKASNLMGRDYFVSGKVMKGRQLGRTIGFPTINIIPDNSKLIPAFGAYCTEVLVDNVFYKGITNVGVNPTIDADNNMTIETYLLDFDNDIYDKKVVVFFKDYIRGEKRFNNIEELKVQLACDKAFAMHQ